MERYSAHELRIDEVSTASGVSSYDFDVSAVHDESWCTLLQKFDLGNIWQSPAYGRARWGADRIELGRLSCRGNTAIAAMIALAKVPFFDKPLAYVQFGPVWPLRQSATNYALLRKFLRQLRTHYVEERRMMLWVRPREADSPDSWLTNAFAEAGYSRQPFNAGRGTYKLDLRIPLDDIKARMNRSWQRNLKRALQQDFKFTSREGDRGFESFNTLRVELMTRKKLLETPETNSFSSLCKNPSESAPLETCVCELDGEPLAAIVLSSFGDTGTSVMSATSLMARELRAGYALDWWCINKLRQQGFRYYDLGGDQTPGVNEYKAGLTSCGSHVTFAGPFVAGGNALTKLAVFGTRGLIRSVGRHL